MKRLTEAALATPTGQKKDFGAEMPKTYDPVYVEAALCASPPPCPSRWLASLQLHSNLHVPALLERLGALKKHKNILAGTTSSHRLSKLSASNVNSWRNLPLQCQRQGGGVLRIPSGLLSTKLVAWVVMTGHGMRKQLGLESAWSRGQRHALKDNRVWWWALSQTGCVRRRDWLEGRELDRTRTAWCQEPCFAQSTRATPAAINARAALVGGRRLLQAGRGRGRAQLRDGHPAAQRDWFAALGPLQCVNGGALMTGTRGGRPPGTSSRVRTRTRPTL